MNQQWQCEPCPFLMAQFLKRKLLCGTAVGAVCTPCSFLMTQFLKKKLLAGQMKHMGLQWVHLTAVRSRVLQDFTVIQRHQGRGMSVRSNLSTTVTSHEYAGHLKKERIEKPHERHKSLFLINAYMHLSTCTTGAGWDFLEMEDELRDVILTCEEFNAQSRLWDLHGTNQQGCALEEALSDLLLTPKSTVCQCATVQSTWHWCPKGWHHRRMQKPPHHLGVTTSL